MRKLLVLAGVAAAAAAAPAHAASATNDLTVQLTAQDNCTVDAATLDFGSSTQVGVAAISSSATVNVNCNPGANWTMSLGNGNNFGSGTRAMKDTVSGDTVAYGLYKSDYTTAFSATGTGSGSAIVYGRIAATVPQVTAGSYSDTVVITVTY